jgi:hypothetical protein
MEILEHIALFLGRSWAARSSPAKISSALLAVSLTLAAGCRKQPSLASEDFRDNGKDFGVAAAMKMFYGNYDLKKQASVAWLSREKSSLPEAGDEKMIVREAFTASRRVGQTEKFVLLTAAVPSEDEEFYCHACAPVIGMAVFSKNGDKWTMVASNKTVTFAGGFGKVPADIQLLQIGPERYAVKIVDVGTGQGETTTVMQLLVPWRDTVNLALERIIADDNKGGCDRSEGLPCYANYCTLTMHSNLNVEYFDLELDLKGTDFPISDNDPISQIRNVHGSEVLKFESGQYVRVSRRGDVTFVEDSIKNQGRRE